jgi:hypothetical protein
MSPPEKADLKVVTVYPADIEQAIRNFIVSKLKVDHNHPIFIKRMEAGYSYQAYYKEGK